MTKSEVLATLLIVCVIAIAAFVSTISNGKEKRRRHKRELERKRWKRLHGIQQEEDDKSCEE